MVDCSCACRCHNTMASSCLRRLFKAHMQHIVYSGVIRDAIMHVQDESNTQVRRICILHA
eukprot:6173405-Pleurochrysis_carterae.AAC.2